RGQRWRDVYQCQRSGRNVRLGRGIWRSDDAHWTSGNPEVPGRRSDVRLVGPQRVDADVGFHHVWNGQVWNIQLQSWNAPVGEPSRLGPSGVGRLPAGGDC